MTHRFYVSCRPLRIGNVMLTPKEHLRAAFSGIPIRHECVAANPQTDGRMLYMIEVPEPAVQEVVLEGLQIFSAHLKTPESALDLAMSLVPEAGWMLTGDDRLVAGAATQAGLLLANDVTPAAGMAANPVIATV